MGSRKVSHFVCECADDQRQREATRFRDAQEGDQDVGIGDSVHLYTPQEDLLGKKIALEQHLLGDVHAHLSVLRNDEEGEEKLPVGIRSQFRMSVNQMCVHLCDPFEVAIPTELVDYLGCCDICVSDKRIISIKVEGTQIRRLQISSLFY